MTGETTVSPSSSRRFQLLEVVGRGSSGDVYLAEQHAGAGFRRKVVLKVLNDDVATMRGAARRIREEARILGLLSHRHIVAVHDLVRVGDRWAILMDWVPGADLERVLEALRVVRGVFPASAALEVGAAILDALDFAAHAPDGAGGSLAVIHRDIKPSNVRLGADGDVKVLDFGVAWFTHQCRETETHPTSWIGTERYLSPERLLREGETAAGDVYAAASTVVELIAGEPMGRTPITPDDHTRWVDAALAGIRHRIEAEPHVVDRVLTALGRGLRAAPSLRPVARELSRELDTLARRVRGPTCKEFARELVPRIDDLLGTGPTPASGVWIEWTASAATPVGTVDTVDLEEAFFAEPPAARRPRRRSAGRRSLAPAALAVSGVLAAGVLIGVGAGTVTVAGTGLPSWAPSLAVRCGAAAAFGTSSARVADLPAGPCSVEATWLGEVWRAEVRLDGTRNLACRVTDGALACAAQTR